MSNIKRRSKKGAVLVMALVMLASVFAVMGLTAEEASAAAKAKKPAKMTIAKVESKNQCAKVSWKKAKKVKVGKKKRTVNYQLKATVKDVWGETSTKTYALKNKTVSKTFYDHPGTKYTFRVRGVYVNKGKKVTGKWSAAKTVTVPTNDVRLSANRSGKGNVIAEANYAGVCKKQKYDTFVFTFNGKTKRAKAGEAVIFDDKSVGTLTVHGTYRAKKNGKTKTIKTKTASKYFKASNYSDGDGATGGQEPTGSANPTQPSTGGAESDMNATSDIKASISFGRNTFDNSYNTNRFIYVFENPVKSKYNWKVTALDNGKLRATLNLADNQKPVIQQTDAHTIYNDDTHYEIITNWLCTDVCLEAYDKSTDKKVFSKTMGYETNPEKILTAPGNIRYGGPYYDRCLQVIDCILEDAGYDEADSIKNNIKTLKEYLFNRLFLCVKYECSMNVKKNLGFFENELYSLTGSGEYLDTQAYDYSKILAYLLGIDAGDCFHSLMVETLIVKRIDPNAVVEVQYITSGELAGHASIKASMKDVSTNTTVEVPVDFSSTKYRGGYDMYESGGREANAMYNDPIWRSYFRGALGTEAAAYYGL